LVKNEPIWKRTVLDLAAIFFLVGGIVILMSTIVLIPIETIYPFKLKTGFNFSLLLVLIIGIICAIESFECFNFSSKRMLQKSGVRGIVIGAILLSVSSFAELNAQGFIAGAILILVGGIINYIYRE